MASYKYFDAKRPLVSFLVVGTPWVWVIAAAILCAGKAVLPSVPFTTLYVAVAFLWVGLAVRKITDSGFHSASR